MRFLHIAALALALGCSAPTLAHEERPRDPFAALEPGLLVHGAIRESDVTLLLDYLRGAILAAAEGREPDPPPQALEKRARELGAELKARGTLAGLLLLNALEEHAKALVREFPPPARRPALPPTVPYTPASSH